MNSYVSMERYWNYVAVPFFFIILGFGAYVLFTLSPIQITGQSLSSRVASIAALRNSAMRPAAKQPA